MNKLTKRAVVYYLLSYICVAKHDIALSLKGLLAISRHNIPFMPIRSIMPNMHNMHNEFNKHNNIPPKILFYGKAPR